MATIGKNGPLAFLPLNPDRRMLSVYLSSLWQRNRAYLYFICVRQHTHTQACAPRYPLALPRPPARSPQRAALPPHARRPQVIWSVQKAPAPVTRGYPRAQPLQRPWSCSERVVEEAPACREQSRARDQVPSAFGRREVCSHGAERAGGCTSESCAPLPPRRERSRRWFAAAILLVHRKNVAPPPPTARRRGRG